MKPISNQVSWLHRLAALVAVLGFALSTLGALINSNAALGLGSPLGVAASFSWIQLSGGTKYEPAYRILTAAAVLLATAAAAWLWRTRADRYIKVLGTVTACAAGLKLWFNDVPFMPAPSPLAHTLHSGLGDLFFGLAVCLAIFTRTDWTWTTPKIADVASPSFRTLLMFTTAMAFLTSFLGTQTRPSVFLHLLSGCVMTAAALWTVEIALDKYPGVMALKIPSILVGELAFVQLFLGLVAHSMALNWRASPQPMPGLAVINATHAALGALVLAACLFATFQAYRHLASRSAEVATAAPLPVKSGVDAYDPK